MKLLDNIANETNQTLCNVEEILDKIKKAYKYNKHDNEEILKKINNTINDIEDLIPKLIDVKTQLNKNKSDIKQNLQKITNTKYRYVIFVRTTQKDRYMWSTFNIHIVVRTIPEEIGTKDYINCEEKEEYNLDWLQREKEYEITDKLKKKYQTNEIIYL